MEDSTIIAEGTRTQPHRARRSPETLDRGSKLGRYVVLERLGAGAMGTVYAAFDPELDRRVALKVLHPALGQRDRVSPARLHREAQALARLTHPNVVTVHDVGIEGSQVFLAMELIDGLTLKEWLASAERSPDEILEVCIEAGRGLVAAHEQGLVHRDFKPDNVMVGHDGRVLVMDFGLARGDTSASSSGAIAASANSLTSAELTRTGTVLGTPAYMSAEQFAGKAATAKSDQFAFCVTMWEALYGRRPFVGDSLASLASAVRNGEVREVPARVRVRSGVRTALGRGLSADPTARWDSMEALLAALAPRRGNGRVAMVVAVVATAGTVWLATGRAEDAQPCGGAGDRVAAVWNDERRDAIHTAFSATALPFAETTWDRAGDSVDVFFERWETMHESLCRATHVHHEQSESRLDVRMDCLDAMMLHADALLDELAAADADLVTRAPRTVGALPDPRRCETRTAEQVDGAGVGEAAREAVQEARRQHAIADARVDAKRAQPALEAAHAGLAALGSLDVPDLRANLLLERAKAESDLGEIETSEVTLKEGLRIANRSNDPRPAAALWIQLLNLYGVHNIRPEATVALALPARLAVERSRGEDLEIQLEAVMGIVLLSADRPEEALTHFEAAIDKARDLEGYAPEHIAVYRNNYGLALYELGRLDQALAEHVAVTAIEAARFGESHPFVSRSLINQGRVVQAKGDFEGSRALYERALADQRSALGSNHVEVGDTLLNLGILNRELGRLEVAREQLEEARRIYDNGYGPEHARTGLVLLALGVLHYTERDLDAAFAVSRQALDIIRKSNGPTHTQTFAALNNFALIVLERGDETTAVRIYEEIVAGYEKVYGPDHDGLPFPLLGMAQALSQLERHDEAVAAARRALEIREAAGLDPRQVATARYVLAIVLDAAGTDPAGAMALAVEAAETMRPDGSTPDALHAQVAEWIASRTSDATPGM